MQSGKSIINLPLVIGIAFSVALHVMALYSRGIYTPPEVKLESGRTVVQLTLVPTAASQTTPPEPPPPEPAESPKEEPKPADPIPTPEPEPVAAPRPKPAKEMVQEPEPEPEPAQETTVVDAMEQNSTVVEDKGVTTVAVARTAIRPKYPRISQRRNEEGDVTLHVDVLASGKPGAVRVVESSGHKRLDEAALEAVQKATFEPARKFGQAVGSETEITITFKLTDE